MTAGVADLRRVISDARDRMGMSDERTILFVDEIHRFNKAQQDVHPAARRGRNGDANRARRRRNPSFEIISPLLSRARVYTLQTARRGAGIADN